MPTTFEEELLRIRQPRGLSTQDIGGGMVRTFVPPPVVPAQPTKVNTSVMDAIAMRDRGGPNMSLITDPRTGKRLTNAEAQARMPQGGYGINLLGSVGFGGGGGYGGRGHSSMTGGSRGRSTQSDGYYDESPRTRSGPRTAADYIREKGGLSPQRPSLLNELYRNQPGQTRGAFDRLQEQRVMDKADPNSAFLADQVGVAQGRGDYDQAAFFQQMLEDRLAQDQSGMIAGGPAGAQGVPSDGGGPQMPQPYPGEKRMDEGGNTWRWNDRAGHGEMIQKAPTFMDLFRMQQDAQRDATQQYVPNTNEEGAAILGEGTMFTPYGTASVTQGAQPSSRGPGATFNNPQGSSLGGVNFPGYQGNFSAEEMFQDSANRQGIPNKYSVPSPGFGGTPDTASAWNSYYSAMNAKNMLKRK